MTAPPDKTASIADLIETALTKALSGHWVGEVFGLAMALEELVDMVLCLNLVVDDDWTQDLVQTEVLSGLHPDHKRRLVRKVLVRQGMEDTVLDPALAAIADLANLRNTMAHGVAAVGMEGFTFKGYRRGKDVQSAVSSDAIEAKIAAGKQSLVDISTFVRADGADSASG